MNKKYEEIFASSLDENLQFVNWKEFIVEFLINQYDCQEVPEELYDDPDLIQSRIASAMHDELMSYCNDSTPYLKEYMEVLTRYIYE